MPVVTITTFHVGVSVVAYARVHHADLKLLGAEDSSAIGRMASVSPFGTATIPKPFFRTRQLAHSLAVMLSRETSRCGDEGELDRLAFRPGRRDDMTAPVGGSAATNSRGLRM